MGVDDSDDMDVDGDTPVVDLGGDSLGEEWQSEESRARPRRLEYTDGKEAEGKGWKEKKDD